MLSVERPATRQSIQRVLSELTGNRSRGFPVFSSAYLAVVADREGLGSAAVDWLGSAGP